ncbi:hypothetical protein Ancab_033543 [Ancistrocladus abbreviatus]
MLKCSVSGGKSCSLHLGLVAIPPPPVFKTNKSPQRSHSVRFPILLGAHCAPLNRDIILRTSSSTMAFDDAEGTRATISYGLGNLRRITSIACFRNSFWFAYITAGLLLSYLTGLFRQITFQAAERTDKEILGLWGIILLYTLGVSGNTTAFSLQDNENPRRTVLVFVFQSFWVLTVLFITFLTETSRSGAPFLLWLLMTLRVRERQLAMNYASLTSSTGVVSRSRKIAEYMRKEHELSNEVEADPSSMRGYKYLVGVSDAKTEWTSPSYVKQFKDPQQLITTDKIWDCEGRLLSSAGGDQLKDLCLSFALFWMLLRRFGGHPIYESSHDKTRRFICDGLFPGHDGHDDEFEYERAFRVIEVELNFLYDYFYTRYYAIYAKGITKKSIQLGILGLFCWLAIQTHKEKKDLLDLVYFQKGGGYNMQEANVSFTWIVLIAITGLELVQIGILLCSDWSKVLWLCSYVRKQLWKYKFIETMIGVACCAPWSFKRWKQKLDQHSLLHDHRRLCPKRCHCLVSPFICVRRVKLSKQVKKAVATSIRTSIRSPELPNGAASLRRNDARDFYSDCQMETHTHVILVWHIATSLCEIHFQRSAHSRSVEEKTACSDNFHVATVLSKYCAYLVAFAPELLPDSVTITRGIYHRVVNFEAKKMFRGCNITNESKYKKLMAVSEEQSPAILEKGALLGKGLINKIGEEAKRWKVLADFWAELIVFLAPTENVRAHAEHLAVGGEFITHIWALLTHGGILKSNNRTDNVAAA